LNTWWAPSLAVVVATRGRPENLPGPANPPIDVEPVALDDPVSA